jgi:hypothetical protein
MADEATAIERCAYCRDYVPVTPVDIPPQDATAPSNPALRARVPICDSCFHDGR